MNSINRTLLTLIILTGVIGKATAMEPTQENTIARKIIFPIANKDTSLGNLAPLNDDTLCQVFLFCIEWDKTTRKDCFEHIMALCLTSKYLNNFAYTKLQEHPKVKEFIFQRFIKPELDNYCAEKIKTYELKYYKEFNALHYAAFDWDITFIKEILPKLKKIGKADYVNQEGRVLTHAAIFTDTESYNKHVPIDFIVNDTDSHRPHHSDKEKCELLKLYFEAGAKPSLYALSNAFYLASAPPMHRTFDLLASKLTCAQIEEEKQDFIERCNLEHEMYGKDLSEASKDLEQLKLNEIKKNHKCSTCNFMLE